MKTITHERLYADRHLENIAISTGWHPQDWHRTLSRKIPPMAVYGIFKDADFTPQRRVMSFPHLDQLERAKPYQEVVKTTLGVVCMVSAESDGW